MAAPGGAAAGLMLCDRAVPPDNWLPPAEEGCGLVSPRWRVRGCVRPRAAGARVPPGALRLVGDGRRLCRPERIPGGRLLRGSGLTVSRVGHLIVCHCEQLSPGDGVPLSLHLPGSDWGCLLEMTVPIIILFDCVLLPGTLTYI